ncbi:MAG: lipopolysaccharide biosynthesis protein [Bryobacterales bacterium]|nr:lipopolysaccharide biosynthesis protein [Bryobacterales bacterium]
MAHQGKPPSGTTGSQPDTPAGMAPAPTPLAGVEPASLTPGTLSPGTLSPGTLSEESRTTLRQVVLLAAQRVAQIAAGFLYVALIPRAMGPEVYGQFTTLQSISLWFSMLSGLGALSMMTRFVPEFIQRNDSAGLRKLCASLLTLRLGTAAAGALIYFALVPLWFGDLDWLAVALVSATISLRVASGLPFTLLLGLNLASRWGAAEMLRRLLLFPLTYGGYHLAGLAGACAAPLAVELLLLLLGLWWTRGYIPPPTLSLDRAFMKPYLSFSAVFFAGNLLIMAFQQGGTPLVRLISGHYAEAGYYSIAFSAYLAGSATLWKLISGFGALFSSLQMQGRTHELAAWTNRLLVGLAIAGVLATALLYSCADLAVERLLGEAYRPVAPSCGR